MATLQPDDVEQVELFSLPKRIQQLRAQYVPEKSTPTRQLYWIAKGRGGDGKWVLVTSRRGVATLAFFPMERCPCEG
jgi:hypothetical protein